MPDEKDNRTSEDGSTVSCSPPDREPDRIGPYKILQKLGEGGMGVVYLAEQNEPIRRRVALKLIKLGMDSKQVIARFEAERQALALMNHPNVAKVFDAGTTDQGRPYFAMEHVKGEPITTFCDKQRLTNRERLELFIEACNGVQHAHQKGIIHRDIKPSNVLVAFEDGKPVPKIIDFGVAKATEQRLTERTMFTQLGVMIGTPEYMSPEQTEMTNQDIDTRTDVYSLGVLLYELMVGALPFDPSQLRAAGFDEIRRRIREDEPSRPSSRITTLGDISTKFAERRRTDPRSLSRQLRGDLDWITMRALEKDPARRYPSPRELAADIQRHTRNEPVTAGAPTTTYRARKFIRRHRIGVVAILAILVTTLAITLLLGSLQSVRSKGELNRISAILDQVVATGAPADSLAPDWPNLTDRLAQEIEQSPGDTLSRLLRRASARLKPELASFGLMSDPPSLDFETAHDVLNLYRPSGSFLRDELVYIADIEIAWDGPPWRFVKTFVDDAGGGMGFSLRLPDVVDEAHFVPGPHRVDVRATFFYLAGSGLSDRDRERLRLGAVWDGPDTEWLPRGDRPAPVFVETRDLGTFPITLFSEYPDEFPHGTPWDPSLGSIEDWLRIDRLRLIRMRLPSGKGDWVSLRMDTFTRGIRLPQDLPRDQLWLGAVQWHGQADDSLPLPIAAVATVEITDRVEPVHEFPFVLGKGFWKSPTWGGSRSTDQSGMGDVVCGPSSFERSVDRSIPDGVYSGRLVLRPSRELALATRHFDQYLDRELSYRIKVEIATEVGEWYDETH